MFCLPEITIAAMPIRTLCDGKFCFLLERLEHTQLSPHSPWSHPHPRARCRPSYCQWVASNTRGAPCCTSILRSGWAKSPCASGKIKSWCVQMQWCDAFSSAVSQCLCFLAQMILLCDTNQNNAWLTNASWLESKCMAISFSSKFSYQFGVWRIDRTLTHKLFSELKTLLCNNLHTWNANVFNHVPVTKIEWQDET